MTGDQYCIGSSVWPGLSKLAEEAGEVLQVIGKIIGHGSRGDGHWDGTNLRDRLTEELADLHAAIVFVADANGLNEVEIDARSMVKLTKFRDWHTEQLAPATQPEADSSTHGETADADRCPACLLPHGEKGVTYVIPPWPDRCLAKNGALGMARCRNLTIARLAASEKPAAPSPETAMRALDAACSELFRQTQSQQLANEVRSAGLAAIHHPALGAPFLAKQPPQPETATVEALVKKGMDSDVGDELGEANAIAAVSGIGDVLFGPALRFAAAAMEAGADEPFAAQPSEIEACARMLRKSAEDADARHEVTSAHIVFREREAARALLSSVAKQTAQPETATMAVSSDGAHAICVDKADPFYGWVMWRHPDGQWVSQRKASTEELARAASTSAAPGGT